MRGIIEQWDYNEYGYKSYDIQEGNSFGLTRVYYAKDLGWHNVLYLTYGYELRSYESKVKYYVYIYTLM